MINHAGKRKLRFKRRPRILFRETDASFHPSLETRPYISRALPDAATCRIRMHSFARSGTLVKHNARIEMQDVLLANVMFPGLCRVSR